MNVLGIIAEYNPFHNGHLYHLKESKMITNADYIVCIMSGNFTQRGEPALANKWIRSKMAVENGVDLVLELPFAFACNNAEYFAKGGIEILNNLGCITHLSFGSEHGDINLLKEAAEHLSIESEQLSQYIKEFSSQGLSFPKARYEALKKYTGGHCSEAIKDANNILAVEYLKQLRLTKSSITPLAIKRYGTGYHDKNTFENIASATSIRDKINTANDLKTAYDFLPLKTYDILSNINSDLNISLNNFYKLILYKYLMSDTIELTNIFSATEGLENKVIKSIKNSSSTETLINEIKSKRYTVTRIQRLLVQTLLNLDTVSFHSIIKERAYYGRVLAFNKKGANLLKHIKKNELNSIPVLTNINREIMKGSKEWRLLAYDIKASDIYNLVAYGEINNQSDYVMKPYKDFI